MGYQVILFLGLGAPLLKSKKFFQKKWIPGSTLLMGGTLW